MNPLHMLIIAAKQGVRADDGDVLKHPHSVFEIADAAALIMAPGYGNFDDAIASLEGDEENLRIESPALDGLQLENRLRGGAGKRLEAALRVSERQSHHGARDRVE